MGHTMQERVGGKEERGRLVVRKRVNPGLARTLRPQNWTGFCSVVCNVRNKTEMRIKRLVCSISLNRL